MIVIKKSVNVKDIISKRYNKKTVECASCGRDLIFFDMAPVSCCYCNNAMPNMQRIMNEQAYRIGYHIGDY